MSSLVWISLACVVLAVGVGLLGYAQHRQQVQIMGDRVQKVIDAVPSRLDGTVETASDHEAIVDWQRWVPAWIYASWSQKQIVLFVALTILIGLFVGVWMHPIFAVIVVAMALAVAFFVTWMRWQRLRARMVLQLPSFIDSMVRMVVLGHATQAAFVMAASSAKEPIGQVVMQAAAFTKAGMSADQALETANRDFKLQELSLLAAVVQVGTRHGGRVDSLLERVANFMRDKEQADKELKAMSAEVRVSAWILSLLPLIVGGMIIMLNAAYFMSLWSDPIGRWVGAGGLLLQLAGTFLLFRLARLDD